MSTPDLVNTVQPVKDAVHLSEQEAVRITQEEDVPELIEFILALKMNRPISTEKAARLIKHLVKEQTASDTTLIADQMLADGWGAGLAQGETCALLANHASAYLATPEGTALFNFFVQTFAKTSGTMFDNR